MTDTREYKLVQEICEKYFPTDQGGYSIKLHKNWIEDAIREAIRLTREEKWIPVTERIPELHETVICYCKDGTVQAGTRYGIGGWYDYAVTHWQPLPTPPEGSSK